MNSPLNELWLPYVFLPTQIDSSCHMTPAFIANGNRKNYHF